jgi:hypothetical protein
MMKHNYQFGLLIIAYLLFTGCSTKEMFYISKSIGSFAPYQKVQKSANLPDSVAILPELSEPEQNMLVKLYMIGWWPKVKTANWL